MIEIKSTCPICDFADNSTQVDAEKLPQIYLVTCRSGACENNYVIRSEIVTTVFTINDPKMVFTHAVVKDQQVQNGNIQS